MGVRSKTFHEVNVSLAAEKEGYFYPEEGEKKIEKRRDELTTSLPSAHAGLEEASPAVFTSTIFLFV